MNTLIHKFYFLLCLIFFSGSAASEPSPDESAKTIRIMTVVIVQQEGFLQYLLAPYLAEKNTNIEYSQGHHSEVVAAAKKGDIDIAITHTKVKDMQKLTAEGILSDARILFANPKAFLGPHGDPAKINGLTDAETVMQRLLGAGFCYVINPHGEMENLQRKLIDAVATKSSCVYTDAKDTFDALRMAHQKNAYTMWGLHPYLAKGDTKLEPVVILDDRLFQNLGIWVVKNSKVQTDAQDLVNYLFSDPVVTRVETFRFSDLEHIQPWWLAR